MKISTARNAKTFEPRAKRTPCARYSTRSQRRVEFTLSTDNRSNGFNETRSSRIIRLFSRISCNGVSREIDTCKGVLYWNRFHILLLLHVSLFSGAYIAVTSKRVRN